MVVNSIKNKLLEIKDYSGVTGNITIDYKGNVGDKEYLIKKVENGKFVLYE